jgi:twitching motility protein PilT
MAKIDAFLKILRKEGASDLHLSTGSPPILRINGELEEAAHRALAADEVRLVVYELLTEPQIEHFEQFGELDCAHTVEGVARFRIHAYKKHPGMAAAFRVIPHEIPTIQELGPLKS